MASAAVVPAGKSTGELFYAAPHHHHRARKEDHTKIKRHSPPKKRPTQKGCGAVRSSEKKREKFCVDDTPLMISSSPVGRIKRNDVDAKWRIIGSERKGITASDRIIKQTTSLALITNAAEKFPNTRQNSVAIFASRGFQR